MTIENISHSNYDYCNATNRIFIHIIWRIIFLLFISFKLEIIYILAKKYDLKNMKKMKYEKKVIFYILKI